MKRKREDQLHLVAGRYRALHEALLSDGDITEQRVLTNQVRDALDRMSTELAPSPPLLIANSFWLDGILHDGETTQVLQLLHRDFDDRFALKTIHPRHAESPDARKRLLRESIILSRIHHPCVIRHHIALRLDDGRPGLLLELSGPSLAVSTRTYSANNILELMQSLLAGLTVVHEAGYVHADICPANLLTMTEEGNALKIADFGISIPLGTTHEAAGYSRAFTPDFTAPEQIAGKPLDERSDIYAAGRVLAFLLYHSTASDSDSANFHRIITRFTAIEPERRPASCLQAHTILHSKA